MTLLLVQMHGHPGSGKSTLARALGTALPAIVIDKDVIASALIRHGIPFSEAGAPSYQVMYAQTERFLDDGHSVVFDSPCFWPLIEQTTRALAGSAGATWAMIETHCPVDVRDTRLAARDRLESNPSVRDTGPMRPGMYHPECERLVVDTDKPLDRLLPEVLERLRLITRAALTPTPSPDSAGEGSFQARGAAW